MPSRAGWAQFHIVTTENCLLERSGGQRYIRHDPRSGHCPLRPYLLERHLSVHRLFDRRKHQRDDQGRRSKRCCGDKNYGKYSFRQWETNILLSNKGHHSLMVRCTNLDGDVQPASPNWNNSGFMRNVIEVVQVTAVQQAAEKPAPLTRWRV
jgi:hypothetical protein